MKASEFYRIDEQWVRRLVGILPQRRITQERMAEKPYWIRTRPVEEVSAIVFDPPLVFAKVMFPIEAVEFGLKLALSPGKVVPLITIPEGNSWEAPWLIQFPPVS